MKRPVVKAHKRTREVVGRYEGYKEAAEGSGFSASAVQNAAKKMSVSFGDYYWRHEDEFDPEEDFMGKQNCPVLVKDTKTGEIAWFGCVKAAAEKLGQPASQVHSCIKRNHKVWGRFIVKYYGKRIA